VEADELARPVSLLLRAHLIDESAGEFRLQADITLGLKQDPKIDYAACLPCDAPQSMALRNLHEVAANIPF